MSTHNVDWHQNYKHARLVLEAAAQEIRTLPLDITMQRAYNDLVKHIHALLEAPTTLQEGRQQV